MNGTKAALLVALPRQAGWMRFVCHLTSVLTGVVCAVMSVKYISQLGNVGKLTPVQCLTNHVNTNVLAHTYRQNEKEKETKKGKKPKHYPLFYNSSQKHFKQACFITTTIIVMIVVVVVIIIIIIIIILIIIVQYKPTWSINNPKKQTN